MRKPRHIKTRRRNTWRANSGSLRIEVQKICKEYDIRREDFSEVNINEWKGIEEKVWGQFSSSQNSRWIWETLTEPYSGLYIHDYKEFQFEEFLDMEERCWFLLDESVNGGTKFWVYEGTPTAFKKIFWESYTIDEVLIVSKKYDWLFSINHHDVLVGTGKVKERIDQLKERE